MPSISRRGALRGISAGLCAAFTAGCTTRLEDSRGAIELINLSAEPVFFTVSAESAGKPDDQQTPMFRTRYYGFPEDSVVLPNAVGDESRVSILVHEDTEEGRGTTLASGQETFTPSKSEPTLYVRYDSRDNEAVTFDSGQ